MDCGHSAPQCLLLSLQSPTFTVISVCVCLGGENKDREVEKERGEYRVGTAFVCFTPRATRCPKGWV